jgi:hypothetical protein
MHDIQVVVTVEVRVKFKINWTAVTFCIMSVTLCNIHITDVFVCCVTTHHRKSFVNVEAELPYVDSLPVGADFLVTGPLRVILVIFLRYSQQDVTFLNLFISVTLYMFQVEPPPIVTSSDCTCSFWSLSNLAATCCLGWHCSSSSRGVVLTSHPHLEPRLKKE